MFTVAAAIINKLTLQPITLNRRDEQIFYMGEVCPSGSVAAYCIPPRMETLERPLDTAAAVAISRTSLALTEKRSGGGGGGGDRWRRRQAPDERCVRRRHATFPFSFFADEFSDQQQRGGEYGRRRAGEQFDDTIQVRRRRRHVHVPSHQLISPVRAPFAEQAGRGDDAGRQRPICSL